MLRMDVRNDHLGDRLEEILVGSVESSASEMSLEEQDEIIASSDPSRLPPRIYLRIPRCIEDIEKEVSALVKTDSRGIPSLAVIHLKDPRYAALPRTHSTMVAKQKNPSLMKARLCVRGDEISSKSEYDTSAPTASSVSLEMTVFLPTKYFQTHFTM